MDDDTFWAMAYMSLVAIKAHPRNNADPNLTWCANMADEMLMDFRQHKIIENAGITVEENPCHSG